MVYRVNLFAMPGMQHVNYALEYKVFALVLPLWSAHPILTLHSGHYIQAVIYLIRSHVLSQVMPENVYDTIVTSQQSITI